MQQYYTEAIIAHMPLHIKKISDFELDWNNLCACLAYNYAFPYSRSPTTRSRADSDVRIIAPVSALSTHNSIPRAQ